MRSPISLVPFCVVLLAACDSSVTRPTDRARSKPDQILLFGSTWGRMDLNFEPRGMNDAGAIVGSQGNEAVLWQNGILTILPHRAGVAGPYVARAITPNGMILGSAGTYTNEHGLYWILPTAPPNDISDDPFRGFVPVYPVGINDSYTIVGEMNIGGNLQAFRWTPTTGFQNISRGTQTTFVVGLTSGGYIGGYDSGPLLWPPNAAATVPASPPQGLPNGISDAGALVGWGLNGSTFQTTVWNTSGGFSFVPGAPNYAEQMNRAGRIVGDSANLPYTYFNGSLTRLSVSSARADVEMVGVNSCGNRILGWRVDTTDAGYLWTRNILSTTQCDTPPLILAAYRR